MFPLRSYRTLMGANRQRLTPIVGGHDDNGDMHPCDDLGDSTSNGDLDEAAQQAARRRQASRLAVAAAGLASCEIPPYALELLERLDRGELTHEQAVAEIIARHQNTGWD